MTENEQKKTGEELDDQKYILVSDDSWFEIEEEFWAANANDAKAWKARFEDEHNSKTLLYVKVG